VEGVRPADRPKKTLNKLQIKTARYNNYVRTMLQTVVNGSGSLQKLLIRRSCDPFSLFICTAVGKISTDTEQHAGILARAESRFNTRK